MKKKYKKGEGPVALSFGMIFSVLLMIFFVIVAFMVIKHFLNVKDCAKIGIFVDNLQTEVDKSWNSQSSIFLFEQEIPSKIEYVCFADLSKNFIGEHQDVGEEIEIYRGKKANFFLSPIKKSCDMPYFNIQHLNIEKITINENPFCIKINKGKVKMRIEKKFDDRLVNVYKEE